MVSEFFTHDECLIIEMYLRKSRGEVIEDIENAMPYIILTIGTLSVISVAVILIKKYVL